MTQIDPYLTFDGNCAEAMTFYRDCLGGELSMQKIGGTPVAAEMPAGSGEKILHSTLKAESFTMMASDCVGPVGYTKGTNLSLMINCGSSGEVETLFSKFSDGATTTCPVGEQFWGGTFGSLTDRFGVNWSFSFVHNAQG